MSVFSRGARKKHRRRTPRFLRPVLHAKTVVVDGFSSMVGSTNMDFRSFHFNSECNVLVLDGAVAESLERQFAVDLAGAKEITLAEWGRRTSLHEFGDFCARALSPVL